MNPDQWLMHDINQLSGDMCRCDDCNAKRDRRLMCDINLYGCKIAADIEAGRKRGIQ